MRVWPYGRFSCDAQEEGDSRRRQDAAIAGWIERRGIPAGAVQRTVFDAGLSGYHGDHLRDGGGLAQIVTQIDNGVIRRGDVLLVESLDRLSRLRPSVAQGLLLRVIGAGVVVEIIDGDYRVDTASYDSGDGTLWRIVGEIERAHRESSRKSSMVSASWSAKRSAAGAGARTQHRAPRWLRWDGESGEYLVIPERADAVRRIYEWCLEGHGSKTVTRMLHSAGIPPFGGACWTEVYVQKILTSRTVLGEVQFNRAERDDQGRKILVPDGDPIPGYYPRVIEDGAWEQVSRQRADRAFWRRGARRGETPNILQGRIVCTCGGSMQLEMSTRRLASGRTRTYRYYACSRYRQSQGQLCGQKRNVHKSLVEEIVVMQLLSRGEDLWRAAEVEAGRSADAGPGRRAELVAERKRLVQRIDNWVEVLGDLPPGARAKTLDQVRAAEERQGAIDGELDALDRPGDDGVRVVSALADVERAWHGQVRQQLQGAIARLVRRVVVDAGARSLVIEPHVGDPICVAALDDWGSIRDTVEANLRLGRWDQAVRDIPGLISTSPGP